MEEAEGYRSSKQTRLKSLLSTLLDDPVLKDVPRKPTVHDVETLIGLELGSAMKIFIHKMDNTVFDVAVQNSATVKDLKSAIQKKINEMEQSQMGHRHISWKHVWSNFCLCYANQKLTNDESKLQDAGIRNNSQVHFMRHLATREAGRHSRPKKRRFFHGLSKQY
eukprot:TRINITY_DN3703_c0_g1_i1.p1 TRINITY_DN3703_c0_g1~~TRINITY_DN3703_c0_g1_i1.p1  ORF type:complete len:165 (-),score=25.78 TRINITY_DN3703_c0_g1_i1:225-719(-)